MRTGPRRNQNLHLDLVPADLAAKVTQGQDAGGHPHLGRLARGLTGPQNHTQDQSQTDQDNFMVLYNLFSHNGANLSRKINIITVNLYFYLTYHNIIHICKKIEEPSYE
jgi:hypothetical protein